MTLSTAADPLGRLDRGLARNQLAALAGVVEDLAGQFELRPLLDRILRHAADLLGCSSGSICTVDERAGTYRKEVDLGVSCRSGNEFPLTEGVTGEILRAGGPVTFSEYANVRGGHIDSADRVGLHATIGVPIRWAGAVIGTCIVFSRDPDRRFDSSDVMLLELFAGHAGLAMVNARMHAQAAELARAEATGLERERVVRDVHDSVARALASVVLHLGADGPQRGADAPPAPEPGRDRLDLARQAAQTALSETRRTVWGPGPQVGTPAGASRTGAASTDVAPADPLVLTIEQSIQAQVAWACSTGLDIRLVVAGPSRVLPTEVAEEIFTQARQAIANIVAHADARTARVGLVYGASDVVLLIQDDGVGFDAAEVPRPDGSRADWSGTHGSRTSRPVPPELTETASRTENLGGTVQTDTTPGWGTTIRVAIPYHYASPAPPRATVLVVEHRPLVRAGLLALLGQTADSVQVVGEIDDGSDALDAYRLLQPTVVLIDVALPDGAVGLIGALRDADPDAAVVAVGDASAANDGRLRELVQAGARAAVLIEADAAAFARAIHAAARGEGLFTDEVLHGLYDSAAEHTDAVPPALTPREMQVRDLVSRGLPDKQIAELLHISVKTVEKHVGSALRKTGARNRTELAGMTNWGAG